MLTDRINYSCFDDDDNDDDNMMLEESVYFNTLDMESSSSNTLDPVLKAYTDGVSSNFRIYIRLYVHTLLMLIWGLYNCSVKKSMTHSLCPT